ncbi:MAG: hypothetical protein AUK54_01560 [Helicobacteraceae bacterium CG2_30_36_10]|nr:MAG: hypothetical protein AUK54_01560 [Helicobacteraceae bacterium CG2_30_36_10]
MKYLLWAPLEEAFYIEPKTPGGRPPYDKLMMFKIVILQKYYNLSDEQTEFQIKDRLSGTSKNTSQLQLYKEDKIKILDIFKWVDRFKI